MDEKTEPGQRPVIEARDLWPVFKRETALGNDIDRAWLWREMDVVDALRGFRSACLALRRTVEHSELKGLDEIADKARAFHRDSEDLLVRYTDFTASVLRDGGRRRVRECPPELREFQ